MGGWGEWLCINQRNSSEEIKPWRVTGKWPHQKEREGKKDRKRRWGKEEKKGEGWGGGRGRRKGEGRKQAIQEQGSNCHIQQKPSSQKRYISMGPANQVLQNPDSTWEKPNVWDSKGAYSYQTFPRGPMRAEICFSNFTTKSLKKIKSEEKKCSLYTETEMWSTAGGRLWLGPRTLLTS